MMKHRCGIALKVDDDRADRIAWRYGSSSKSVVDLLDDRRRLIDELIRIRESMPLFEKSDSET